MQRRRRKRPKGKESLDLLQGRRKGSRGVGSREPLLGYHEILIKEDKRNKGRKKKDREGARRKRLDLD